MHLFIKYFKLCITCILMASCGVYSQGQVTITIDKNTKFQEITGFGAFNTLSAWRGITEEKKYAAITSDLGLSIMRFELPPTFRPFKDSGYNVAAEVFGGPDLKQNFKDVKALYASGVKKFIASVWSPPAWMKTPNDKGEGPDTKNGGHLRENAYGDFADYLAAYCKTFKKQTGVDLYAVGLQNEPEFPEPYNSCLYTPSQLRETLRAVGRKFMKEKLSTKIYVPEALPAQNHLPDYFKAINDDPETRQYAQSFAIHNYDRDGINVGGAGSRDWQEFAQLAVAVHPKKSLWMTETSGHPNNWEGAMLLAANLYNALNYGNLSAWLWWAIADQKSSEAFALIVDGQPTGRYYVSKHFYHFIRPKARRVATASSDTAILPLAFTGSGKYKLVAILINKGDGPRTVLLPLVTGKEQIYLSTENRHCERQPHAGKVLLLPAKSIATISWQ